MSEKTFRPLLTYSDEFHHAAASTYQKLLSHFKPKILLGLTATPERMDVLDYFDGRIAAEIRLPEAVDRKLLCPFHYFGISDTVDLKDVTWSKGGYDKKELEKVYYIDLEHAKQRVSQIVKSLDRYVTDINTVKGLGFCVSIGHAQFMSDQFNACGIPSICLTGLSSEEEISLIHDHLPSFRYPLKEIAFVRRSCVSVCFCAV